MYTRLLAMALAAAHSWAQPTDAIDGTPYTLTGNVNPTHDPAVAREGNQYYVFGTDTGYRTPPFLQFKCSPDLINFKFCGHVFAAWPAWVRTAIPGATNIWAPDVSFSPTQQRWNLYYAVSTFGSQSSVIGLASTPTLDPTNASYAWRDDGLVMQSSNKLDYNAIDPSLFYDASGAAWLTLGSFWTGIKVVSINVTTGKVSNGAQVVALATRNGAGGAIEASFMVYQSNYYYLFTSWDKCCAGNSSTYNVRVGRSSTPTGPFVDSDGVALTAGGGTYLIGHRAFGWAAGGGQSILRQSGPANAAPNSIMIMHAYAASNGDPWMTFVPLDWSSGWPKAL